MLSPQVLALSATYPAELGRLAEKFMRSPQQVRPGQSSQVLTGVAQVNNHKWVTCKFESYYFLLIISPTFATV